MFGPFIIKEGRDELTRYATMFEFLASRAVQIGIQKLTGDRFIYVNHETIYRKAAQIGTNFVGAGNALKKLFNERNHQ